MVVKIAYSARILLGTQKTFGPPGILFSNDACVSVHCNVPYMRYIPHFYVSYAVHWNREIAF